MTHRGCGGKVEEDWSKVYEHEGSVVPSFVCRSCGQEILGDAQIEDADERKDL